MRAGPLEGVYFCGECEHTQNTRTDGDSVPSANRRIHLVALRNDRGRRCRRPESARARLSRFMNYCRNRFVWAVLARIGSASIQFVTGDNHSVCLRIRIVYMCGGFFGGIIVRVCVCATLTELDKI